MNFKSVLLIDDDEDDKDFFITALSEIKNATLFDVATNGKGALELLRNTVVLPDLIFTDIHMPYMNGIEFLAEITKDRALKNIPVIMLSGTTELIELSLNLGAKAFIIKPNKIETLKNELEEAIQLESSLL